MPTLATVTRVDADTVGIKMHADEDSMLHGMFIPLKRGESLGDKPYSDWVTQIGETFVLIDFISIGGKTEKNLTRC